MAKRQKVKRFSIQAFDNAHYKTTESYVRAVDALFDAATKDISSNAAKLNTAQGKAFKYDDFPSFKKQMQKTIDNLAQNVTTTIETGSRKQWLYACDKNDAFIDSIMDTSKLKKSTLKKMQDRNLDALATFQERKVNGMNLSTRVWNYVGQYRDQMEQALDVGLGEGRSAQQLARDVKQNLKDPNRLFRRVRDKRGNLVLSKNAKAFHPGAGVYRSSAKNAQRLTRSEINMAYRESDFQRWKLLDFVVGFEVVRSNHQPLCKCKLCEQLKGKYPKEFEFKGWHPQCMCYAIPILADEKTINDNEADELKAALRGTSYTRRESPNKVNDVPQGFKDWCDANKSNTWKSTPYFVRDNFKNGNIADGLKFAVGQQAQQTQQTATQTQQVQQTAKTAQAQQTTTGQVAIPDSFFDEAKNRYKIAYNEVQDLQTKLTHDEIVERLGGKDKTGGSCVSVALAYAANKAGLDVLDYRGGESLRFFGRSIDNIVRDIGGVRVSESNDYIAAQKCFNEMKVGKEYIVGFAEHTAIMRRHSSGKGVEFLELQGDVSGNVWTRLTTANAKTRFGCKRSHSRYGRGYKLSGSVIDIEELAKTPNFRELMGYLNTAKSKQLKGEGGGRK